MPINPLIPLAGNRSRLPDIIALGNQRRDRLAQNEVTNRQNQETIDLQQSKFSAAEAETSRLAGVDRENEAIRSIAIYYETDLKPLLESNDIQGSLDSLNARKNSLLVAGTNTEDTDEAIKLLTSGNIAEVKRQGEAITQAARMRELIPEAEQTTAEKAEEAAAIARAKALATTDIPTRISREETGGVGAFAEGPVTDKVLRRQLRADLISDNQSVADATVALDDLERSPGAVGISGAIIDSSLLKIIGQIPGVGKDIQGGVSQALAGTDPTEVAAVRTRTRTLVASQLSNITGEESGRFTEQERAIAEQTLRGLETSDNPETIRGALRTVLEIGIGSRIRNRRELGIEPKHDLNTPEGRGGLIQEMMDRSLTDREAIDFVKRLVKEEQLR